MHGKKNKGDNKTELYIKQPVQTARRYHWHGWACGTVGNRRPQTIMKKTLKIIMIIQRVSVMQVIIIDTPATKMYCFSNNKTTKCTWINGIASSCTVSTDGKQRWQLLFARLALLGARRPALIKEHSLQQLWLTYYAQISRLPPPYDLCCSCHGRLAGGVQDQLL